MTSQNQSVLDIAVKDGQTVITRNYESALVIDNKERKELLALLDAIVNPHKYIIHIHDLREKDVYSTLTGCVSPSS